MSEQQATLGGGCFWCLEAVYDRLKGVQKVVSGYTGGHVENPTYQQVCNKTTGHAEVVQITYDDSVVTFEELLDVFFTIHDPTTPNRQGNDVGPQYRSAIFYHNDEQKRIAEEKIEEFDNKDMWSDPIVTEVTELETFYAAEDYHQDYFKKNPDQGYCSAVIKPKINKLREDYSEKIKKMQRE